MNKNFLITSDEEEMLNVLGKLFFRLESFENNNSWNNSIDPKILNYEFIGYWNFNILKLERVISESGLSKVIRSFCEPIQIELTYQGNEDLKISITAFYTIRHYLGITIAFLFCTFLLLWINLFEDRISLI